MKLDTNLKSNKKLTMLFVIIILVGISSSIARRKKAGNKTVNLYTEQQSELPGEDPVMEISGGSSTGDKEIAFHDDWGKDPFKIRNVRIQQGKGGSSSEQISDFILTAILTDGKKASAVINGEVYFTGQTISGYTITNISPQRVTLKKNNDTMILKL